MNLVKDLELNDSGNIKASTANFLLLNKIKHKYPENSDMVKDHIKNGSPIKSLYETYFESIRPKRPEPTNDKPIIVELVRHLIEPTPEENKLEEIIPRRSKRKKNI